MLGHQIVVTGILPEFGVTTFPSTFLEHNVTEYNLHVTNYTIEKSMTGVNKYFETLCKNDGGNSIYAKSHEIYSQVNFCCP